MCVNKLELPHVRNQLLCFMSAVYNGLLDYFTKSIGRVKF